MSSHDAIPLNPSGIDADAQPVVPSVPTTPDGEEFHRLDIRLDSSSGSSDGIGSSTFGIPTLPIAPDPILSVLADAASPVDESELPPEQPFSVPVEPMIMEGMVSEEFNPLVGIDLFSPGVAESTPVEPSNREDASAIEDEVVYVSGPNWPMILLASYASAVTLALIWWVVIPKLRGRGELDGFTPGAAVTVGTRRADRSRKVEPVLPIPSDRMVRLGQSIRVGALEITPVNITRTDVTLRRKSLTGKVEDRDGGTGAMALLVKLRNISKDTVFAPLDEAFIRDKDDGISDSYVELSSGERIYLYPLPVESESSIVGQDFPDLKPGEVKETRIITTAEFPSADAGMTWRIRLRTGLDSSEIIGVSIPPDK
jgi:hypothetical protein